MKGIKGMKNTKYNIFYYFILFLFCYIIFELLYSRITYFEKTITIKQKNSFNQGRYGKNIIEDENGNIYIISNSLYFLFFQSIKLYTDIQIGIKYKIKGYGYKLPSLGLYPQIIFADPINS